MLLHVRGPSTQSRNDCFDTTLPKQVAQRLLWNVPLGVGHDMLTNLSVAHTARLSAWLQDSSAKNLGNQMGVRSDVSSAGDQVDESSSPALVQNASRPILQLSGHVEEAPQVAKGS